MPTQSTTYNSRITDEALEKRFRDTFRAQGGAELVDDLYASGVIVPVVDFTAAAEGSSLRKDLQEAWDFSTGSAQITTSTYTNVISNAGFWLVDVVYSGFSAATVASRLNANIDIYDGSTSKPIWGMANQQNAGTAEYNAVVEARFVVFLRANDIMRARGQTNDTTMDIWYRQIATVSGDLVNPTGFTSS